MDDSSQLQQLKDKLTSMKNLRERLAERGEKGFTLIELVIVVAIIGIFTAIAIPSYGAIQHQARYNAVESAVADYYTATLSKISSGQVITPGTTGPGAAGTRPTPGEAGILISINVGVAEDNIKVSGVWIQANGNKEPGTSMSRANVKP